MGLGWVVHRPSGLKLAQLNRLGEKAVNVSVNIEFVQHIITKHLQCARYTSNSRKEPSLNYA